MRVGGQSYAPAACVVFRIEQERLHPEDGSRKLFRNTNTCLQQYTALHPKRQHIVRTASSLKNGISDDI